MQMQQENIREDNFHSPNFTISVSQSNVETIVKLELIGKITYSISQG